MRKYVLIEYQFHRLFVLDYFKRGINEYMFCFDFTATIKNGLREYYVTLLQKKIFVKLWSPVDDASKSWKYVQPFLSGYSKSGYATIKEAANQDFTIRQGEVELLEKFINDLQEQGMYIIRRKQ